MTAKLNPVDYYRLPWSFTDNGISWLEVTARCNLDCKGCYRDRKADGHKSLAEVAEDLEVFKRERVSDCMSIAGGDPLVHPKIVEIVRMVKRGGWKPIVNTNGLALTPELLHDLKKAGVYGFTFHIDTTQTRKDSPDAKFERDHNQLREKFARMLAKEGGIACSFNQTVSERTLSQVPDVLRWAQKNADIVQTMVFILYREPNMSPNFDYFVNGKRIELGNTYWNTGWGGEKILTAQDVVDQLREVEPAFEPCAYLNGSVNPNSFKWLLTTRVGNKDETFGYASARFMELVQNVTHLFTGKWLSYATPASTRSGKLATFGLAIFDKGLRKAAGNIIKSVLRNPLNLFKTTYVQSFMIIQPIDFECDGRMNMCDSCPDITVHKGKLYWSCRLEEIKRYGTFVTAAPKEKRVALTGGTREEVRVSGYAGQSQDQ